MFTNDVCQVLVDHFYDTYIKIPEGETLQEIMKGFENLNGIPYTWELLMVLIFAHQKSQNNNMNLRITIIDWNFTLFFYKVFVIIEGNF